MLGVVLAGGESRRMGRDKALVEVDGEPLWKRQVGVLRAAGAERVVVGRRRGQEAIGYPDCCLDAFEGCGPLAGIHAARQRTAGVRARDAASSVCGHQHAHSLEVECVAASKQQRHEQLYDHTRAVEHGRAELGTHHARQRKKTGQRIGK